MKNILQKSNQKGAALIITLLMITSLSGIVFYTSRLSIREIKLMNGLQESSGAFYAAEAGIEEGLLMWRYNHDAEFSKQCQTKGCQGVNIPTQSDGDPLSFDIDTEAKSSYSLKIWHRNDAKTSETVTDFGQDQVAEYDISNVPNLTLKCDTGCGTDINNSLEYSTISVIDSVASDKDLLFGSNLMGNIVTTNAKKLRVKSWGETPKGYTISTTGGDMKLDSRYTIIESTGFYGNTQRKLRVEIDRASGRILPLYDFVLFGETGINPQ